MKCGDRAPGRMPPRTRLFVRSLDLDGHQGSVQTGTRAGARPILMRRARRGTAPVPVSTRRIVRPALTSGIHQAAWPFLAKIARSVDFDETDGK